jgi:hypothetical protein
MPTVIRQPEAWSSAEFIFHAAPAAFLARLFQQREEAAEKPGQGARLVQGFGSDLTEPVKALCLLFFGHVTSQANSLTRVQEGG